MAFDKTQLEKLSTLLLSSEDLNTQVAFTILENHEFPLELITEIFAIYKTTSNKKIKQQAKLILETHGSQELKWAMAMRYPLKGGRSDMAATEKTIKKNIIQYTHNNELDGVKLAKSLYQKIGAGATYLLTATPQDQRKEILKTFITGTSFQLNNKALTQIPPELFDFPELTHIDLSGNKITSIPKQVEVFKKLQVLNMSNNKLKSIHKNFLKLKKLESLDISSNDFYKAFPEMIFKMTQLKRLNILGLRSYGIYRQNLSQSFFNMKNLEELKLSHGLGRTYPNYPQIEKVTGSPINLDPLEIAYNAFDQGDDHPISYILKYGTADWIIKILNKFYDSTNKSMTFNGIYLEHIPKEISQFEVKRLTINNCGLGYYYGGGIKMATDNKIVEDKKRTAAISSLMDLESLILSQNRLSGISDLSKLQKLKVLNLNGNKFTYYPQHYTSLINLEELYLLNTTDYNLKQIDAEKIKENLLSLPKLKFLKINIPGLPYRSDFYTKTLPELLPNCQISSY